MKYSSKRIISFTVVFVLILSSFTFAYALPKDTKGHWAENRIQKYFEKGTITGYGDGSFKPDSPITRAEFVTIINKYFDLNIADEITFTDVPEGAWYKLQIQKAVKAGYIIGYHDNSFRPNQFVTRQEAAVIIAKLLKFKLEEGKEAEQYIDGKGIPSWSFGHINAMIRHGLLTGYPDNSLRYQKYLTRAEVLSLLDSVTNYRKDVLPEIRSINLSNGKIDIDFSKGAIEDLSIKDFKVTAKLDAANYTLTGLEYNSKKGFFSFDPISKIGKVQLLEVTVAFDSDQLKGSAKNAIEIARKSSSGSSGVTQNTAPTIPVITKIPSGNVSVNDSVTISAISKDAEGDSITYVWTGKLPDGSTYPIGKQVITVKAVDSRGAESPSAALVFFVTDQSGSGGVLLTSPNSRIYENGIEGASITHFTFNVPSVSGHSGYDQAWVQGLNVKTRQWEYVPNVSGTTLGSPISGNPVNISNGVFLEGDLTPGTYSKLEFFYYASHCMYNKSNITYTVDFSFADFPGDAPAEAAPVASNVTVSGVTDVGSVLTGSYVYSDANGDLEGYLDSGYNVIPFSNYQWYRVDDASGTNKTAIAGAQSISYTITNDDLGKYLVFEVTPLAVTGTAGTIEGQTKESTPVLIPAPVEPQDQ